MTTTKAIRKPLLWGSVAAIAVILLAVGVWIGMYYANNVQIDSVISIDVNPSIEITTNKQDTVLEAKAVNEDARAVLDGMELKGTNLQTAVNAIIGSMLKQGYLTDGGENEILVTVQNGNPDKVQELQSMINTSLQNSSVNVPITNGTVENNEEAKALAEEHQISIGKAAYILQLTAADPSLDVSKLSGMSIQELNTLKNGETTTPEQGQQDDTTSSSSSDTTTPASSAPQTSQPSSSTNTASGQISAEQAKQIALDHAGVSASNVTFIKAQLDYDNGILVYDVEFYSGNTEYDYEINAQTGAIHSMDRDVENFSIPNTGNTGGNTSASISADQAKQAALDHAGVSASNVTFIKAQLDYDNGILVYDVEFYSGNTEYDYEINAQTGAVHSMDWDVENFYIPNNGNSGNTGNTGGNTSASISADQAKQIALEHAGLSSSAVMYVKAELDYDHGRLVYDIEFREGWMEYSYEIDANSGAVLKYEKEWDD